MSLTYPYVQTRQDKTSPPTFNCFLLLGFSLFLTKKMVGEIKNEIFALLKSVNWWAFKKENEEKCKKLFTNVQTLVNISIY